MIKKYLFNSIIRDFAFSEVYFGFDKEREKQSKPYDAPEGKMICIMFLVKDNDVVINKIRYKKDKWYICEIDGETILHQYGPFKTRDIVFSRSRRILGVKDIRSTIIPK
ncbi:hypothetical protein [Vibrio sp. RE88]|uniref:hypothetical protein n=1 Tax=Vibrio sp. RE88 TaxID=2607610 RepID=UPI001493916A|nr:hypothetical protein [Vibrio sp. RE88]